MSSEAAYRGRSERDEAGPHHCLHLSRNHLSHKALDQLGRSSGVVAVGKVLFHKDHCRKDCEPSGPERSYYGAVVRIALQRARWRVAARARKGGIGGRKMLESSLGRADCRAAGAGMRAATFDAWA